MKKLLICLMTFLSFTNFTTARLLANDGEGTPITIQPRADVKEWKYKTSNGHIYKRLWNATKQRWETGWIKC